MTKNHHDEFTIPSDLVAFPARIHRSSIPTESEHQAISDWLLARDERLYHLWQVMVVLGARLNDVLQFETKSIRAFLKVSQDTPFCFYEQKAFNQAVSLRAKHGAHIKKPRARQIEQSRELRKALTEAVTYAESVSSKYLIVAFAKGRKRKLEAVNKASNKRLGKCRASDLFNQELTALRQSSPGLVRDQIKAHSARKLFCDRILRRTKGDWKAVQRAIGHKSLEVTRAYLIGARE